MPASAPPSESERLAALRPYLKLGPLTGGAFERVLALAAGALSVPYALVNFIGEAEQFTSSCYGLNLALTVVPRDEAPGLLPVLRRDVVVIEDLQADPRFAPLAAGHPEFPDGVRMYAGAPLITPEGQAIGALCLLDTRVRALDAREREVLRSLAGLVMDELGLRLRAYDLARAQEHARALWELAELMHGELDPAATAQRALTLLHRQMPLDWSGLVRLGAGGAEVLYDHAQAHAEGYREVARLALPQPGDPLWDRLRRPEHLFLDRYPDRPGALPRLRAAGLQSAAWLYLTGSEQRAYGLALARLGGEGAGAAWTSDERTLLEAAAHTVRAALERAEALRALERAALTDALTGLGNRRALDEALDAAERLHARGGAGYVVAVVDLDGMKRVNDERGHASGDDLLRSFALALQDPEVSAYRLGGDEYALLQVAPADHAAAGAALGALVERATREVRALGYPAHASYGVAAVPEDAPGATAALRIADGRMYVNKRWRVSLRLAQLEEAGGEEGGR